MTESSGTVDTHTINKDSKRTGSRCEEALKGQFASYIDASGRSYDSLPVLTDTGLNVALKSHVSSSTLECIMNSVFCRYSSLDPAVIQAVINSFRDGDYIDMHSADRALREMCTGSADELASREQEVAQQPIDVSSPDPKARLCHRASPADLHCDVDMREGEVPGPEGCTRSTSDAEMHDTGAEEGDRKQESSEVEFLASIFTSLDPEVVAAVYQAGSDFNSTVSTLEEMSGQNVLRQDTGTPKKDPEELRKSLAQRFPNLPAHNVAQIAAMHSGDEDACIAHLMAASDREGDYGAGGKVPQDVEAVRERLIQRFPTVHVKFIESLMSRHDADEDACVAHILSSAEETGAVDVTANYEQDQEDASFLEALTTGGSQEDDELRCKILVLRQRIRSELLDQGRISCMPPAERIAAALVFCGLDPDAAQRCCGSNGAASLPPFEEMYNPSRDADPADAPVDHATAPPFDPFAASPSGHCPPDPVQHYNPHHLDHTRPPVEANNPCNDPVREHSSLGHCAAPYPHVDSHHGNCGVAGPSYRSTDPHMHGGEENRSSSASPDSVEVVGGGAAVPLQQLRARLAQPPPDDTLSAVLLCTNGDVAAALQMLSESGMQVLTDSAGTSQSYTHTACAGRSSSDAFDRRHVTSASDRMGECPEEEEAMLVWLWRPRPHAYWVAGEVAKIDMCDGETRLTINTREGVISDVEQGLLWPRGRGEPPPAALQDIEGDEGDAGGEDRGSSRPKDIAFSGTDRHGWQEAAGARRNRPDPGSVQHRLLPIPLPPQEEDEDLSRYKGEILSQKTQQLYVRLNAPLNNIKREISALQRTIERGGSGSSRKRLRALIAEKKVQKQLTEEEVTRRMFEARNSHAEVSKVDYHGITVDTALRKLYDKLKYLKSNPDPVRMMLIVVTGRGLHSKDNFGRLYHAVGEYLSLECTVKEFNIAHTAALGAYLIEIFKDNEQPQPISEHRARIIMNSHH